jgi:hypothetical protein
VACELLSLALRMFRSVSLGGTAHRPYSDSSLRHLGVEADMPRVLVLVIVEVQIE